MTIATTLERANGKVRRLLAQNFHRKVTRIAPQAPIVSFTFDDAPKSAFEAGRDILKPMGARPTYFMSLGLLGKHTEVGEIASADDLTRAVDDGFELGCHTFDHLDAWLTSPRAFLASVERNERALEDILPDYRFQTFSYPKSGATLAVKQALAKRFLCCRGSVRATNEAAADLNLLNAIFIDRRTGLDADAVKAAIDHNAERRGWLIFAMHDIAQSPSLYGCTQVFLERIARYAHDQGAAFLPVAEACAAIQPPIAS